MEFNINGNDSDLNYRYKMPVFKLTVGGKGNGIYTIFNNMDQIAKSINHPPEILFKWIASISGCNYISTRDTITGTHKPDELKEMMINYVKHLVMCPKCSIPETIPKVYGTKKNSYLKLSCSACKNETEISIQNKNIEKAYDIIIKYLNNGGFWIISKGTMVHTTHDTSTQQTDQTNQNNKQTDLFDEIEYNPFT